MRRAGFAMATAIKLLRRKLPASFFASVASDASFIVAPQFGIGHLQLSASKPWVPVPNRPGLNGLMCASAKVLARVRGIAVCTLSALPWSAFATVHKSHE